MSEESSGMARSEFEVEVDPVSLLLSLTIPEFPKGVAVSAIKSPTHVKWVFDYMMPETPQKIHEK